MNDTFTPAIGQTLTVTDAKAAPHHFPPGTRVRVLEDNGDARRGWAAHRWLCRGRYQGRTIVQWLAAEDLTA